MPDDIYGRPCSVTFIRAFTGTRVMLGVGKDGDSYFVFDRYATAEPWHKHCGPYSTFEEGKDWIMAIREV
jgi:hypothetical protein